MHLLYMDTALSLGAHMDGIYSKVEHYINKQTELLFFPIYNKTWSLLQYGISAYY